MTKPKPDTSTTPARANQQPEPTRPLTLQERLDALERLGAVRITRTTLFTSTNLKITKED